MRASDVMIPLSSAEALVLFDFLTRFVNRDVLAIADQAEARVLWNAQAWLETQLVEPLRPDYDELLGKARDEVRDRDDQP
ncbi:MAG TPA: hypothetical protein VHG32_12730 [Thermoanaerobaculia bacterium]|jgi:hypothetical protein|nr:hypothetical protein [Thermoanaerobaculia bacterium]